MASQLKTFGWVIMLISFFLRSSKVSFKGTSGLASFQIKSTGLNLTLLPNNANRTRHFQ
ncbi:hypothetical protein AAHE18_20G107700 [Arachis hypogaea]